MNMYNSQILTVAADWFLNRAYESVHVTKNKHKTVKVKQNVELINL